MHSGQINWKDSSSSPTNTHWDATFYNGLIEGGSSGSPLIDNNHRVIGQLHGGADAECNTNYVKYYGKLDVSWTGNGATDSRRRLKDWLDPAGNNLSTLDGTGLTITGTSIICPYSSVTYTISGNSNNTPVTWTCSSNLTLVSVQGNNATFSTTANVASGAMIQASYSGNTVSRTVYIIQNPAAETHGTVTVNTNSLFTITPQTPDMIDYNWTVQPTTGAVLSNTNGLSLNIRFTQTGTYMVYAYGKNKCILSSTPTHVYVYNVVSPTTYSSYTIYPNPVSDVLNIDPELSLEQQAFATTETVDATTSTPQLDIYLYDLNGNLKKHKKVKKGKVKLNVSNLPNNNYYLNIYDGVNNYPEVHQVVVKH